MFITNGYTKLRLEHTCNTTMRDWNQSPSNMLTVHNYLPWTELVYLQNSVSAQFTIEVLTLQLSNLNNTNEINMHGTCYLPC